MNVVLSAIQGLLAAVFLMAGLTKITQPREKLAAGQMQWTARGAEACGRRPPFTCPSLKSGEPKQVTVNLVLGLLARRRP